MFNRFTAEPTVTDPCASSPCGSNARCDNGICSCLPEYQGDPYVGCRPECVLNTDCPQNLACIRNKCVDPCPGTCGRNAQCMVYNHVPMCSCPSGMVGNAFVQCTVLQGTIRGIFNLIIGIVELNFLRDSCPDNVRYRTEESLLAVTLRAKQCLSGSKRTTSLLLRGRIPGCSTCL